MVAEELDFIKVKIPKHSPGNQSKKLPYGEKLVAASSEIETHFSFKKHMNHL